MRETDWTARVLPHGPLTELAPGLWQATGTLKRNPLPRNMVVWRSPEGGLVVHSPVCLDAPAMKELDALGPVSHLIVPCPMHRMDAPAFAQRYPEARVLAPACAREAADEAVAVHETCEESLLALGVTVHAPAGLSPFELHYELPLEDGSRALVMTDALFNLGPNPPGGFAGFTLKLMGSVGPLGMTRLGRWFLLQNKPAYRAYLEELAQIHRLSVLCVAHGDAVIEEVKAALRAAAARV
jgi:hypothetical protein